MTYKRTISTLLFIPLLFVSAVIFTLIRVYAGAGLPEIAPEIPPQTRYIYGYAYRTVWNKNGQALLITKDYGNILIYPDRNDPDMLDCLDKGAYVRLDAYKSPVLLPKEAVNFGGFDQKQYLAGRGVKYISYINKDALYTNKYPDTENYRPDAVMKIKACCLGFFSSLRESLDSALKNTLGSNTAAAAMAILTGCADGISRENMNMYRNAGIAHVMAVSGMHMSFVRGLCMKAFSRRKILYASRRGLCIICIIIFAGIADFSASVTRAVIVSCYFLIGDILKRPGRPQNALMLAASLQLLSNPYNIYNSGFILSYAAAASIIFICPVISNHIFFFGKIPDSLCSGISVGIGTTPILIQYFNTVSPIGIASTVIASWLAYWICLPGFMIWLLDIIPFCGSVFRYISYIPASLISAAVYGLNAVSEAGSGIPPPIGAFRVPSLTAPVIVLYYSAMIILLLRKKLRIALHPLIIFLKRNAPYYKAIIIALLASASACVFIWRSAYGNRTDIVFFDVGQGFSALIKTDDICGLIDTGDGKTDISTLLYKHGVGTLDFVLITHGHSDHAGGIYDIMNEHNVKCIILPDNPWDSVSCEIKEKACKMGIQVICVRGKQEYLFGDLNVTLYANEKYMNSDESSDLNNSSVIMRAENENGTLLFTGDIEKETESEIVKAGFAENTDVLAVAHHGSDTGSEFKNISIISPEYAIISVGRNNSYGHPSDKVIETLEKLGAHVRRTDTGGDVAVSMRKGKLYAWQKLKT